MSTVSLRIISNVVDLGSFPRVATLARSAENHLAVAALLGLSFLPVLELFLRTFFKTGIPGSSNYIQNITLWVGFLGAMVASREGQHLNLSTGLVNLPSPLRKVVSVFVAAVSTAVASGLFWASYQFVLAETESPVRIGGWLPIWVVESILPAAFAIITVRFVLHAGNWWSRTLAFLAVPVAAVIGYLLAPHALEILWPGMVALLLAAFFGAPIFIVIGGAAILFFFSEGVPIASIPVETYRIVVSPFIPTIPLFTLAGYILAEGGASQRLVRLFRALFGWTPGGLAIAATLVCAFFTTFTV